MQFIGDTQKQDTEKNLKNKPVIKIKQSNE